ncbi:MULTISPECIES: uroporphyrinogen-III synthase [unclassified Pseudoxanthomonas]|uniref:uroporphyrinogen-III synthase n=1 Tax=unclassified Pseudoxanthomonas TaxID=2645906 RepID=UPI0008E97248|nr:MULTISPECIES: uroporphyrinogen-III synthase [unclassified Pseudoxanthomonas]PPJ41027.1 uroporphyrinogen-III synthase [Pseudoxanthomonas sp. KAs_5_3]SFV31459.1 uroporphyrinogen-III synthase [Pseudoxanthomonas sp. YR558]
MGHPTPPAWYVISLRPQGGHDALRRAARRHGAGLLALSPWRIQPCGDPATRQALGKALACPLVMFTSPAAVSAAQALAPLQAQRGSTWLAVGAGTAAALRRAGVSASSPRRMDSEGLLAMPALQDIRGIEIGFVTAPDGRNLLVPTLQARGAQVHRAEVYRRESLALPARALTALAALDRPACLLLSSAGALERVLAQLPPAAAARILTTSVVAASARLAEAARAAGFSEVVQADGPRPAQLMKSASTVMAPRIR